MLHPRTLVLSLAAMLLAAPAIVPGEDAPKKLFAESVRLAAERRHEEAVALMEQVLSASPAHPEVLWNLGLWYGELDRHEDALDAWKRYRDEVPHDWRVRAKLIQAYQALDRKELRDAERTALLEWYDDPGELARPHRELYCREQFRVEEQRVMAFEYFRPSGERRLFLRFSVLDAGGEETAWYSLGSYDLTNDLARATGEIGENEQLYHLDRYDAGSRGTLAFFKRMPTYETVRQHVVAALKGELHPIRSIPQD